MKWVVLLFLVVLAECSDDRRHPEEHGKYGDRRQPKDVDDDHEDVSKWKIDHSLITHQYKDGALRFPPPTIEYGDTGAEQFKKDFTRVGIRWGQEINNVIYRQGVAAGCDLINKIEERYRKLKYSVENSSKKDKKNKNSVNEDFRKLVHQLFELLELKPGECEVRHRPIRELPPFPAKVISQTKNRTATEIFLHLPEFFDEDFSAIYGYVAGIFIKGWQNARKYFDIQQTEYRNQILNGPVLHAYRVVVENVFKQCDSIEGRVDKETWKDFDWAGSRIIKASNEWQVTSQKLKNDEKNRH